MLRHDAHLLGLLFLVACGGGAEDGLDETNAILAEDGAAAPATTTPAAPMAAEPMMAVDTLAASGQRPLLRESYTYQGGGRDPFRSVINVTVSGPELPDLSLVGVIYDAGNSRNSVATFRETGSNRRYNVSPGQSIGRLFVAEVQSTSATLRMNDFGVIREQTYSLRTRENEAQ
jgi:hypothetical protein